MSDKDSERCINIICHAPLNRGPALSGQQLVFFVHCLCVCRLMQIAAVIEFQSRRHKQWADTGYRAFRCLPRQ